MKNTGIVCEYNPYHTGHEHQIRTLRDSGAEVVICVMSGNFTQRGEVAIADKYTRAAAALAGGANVVLELPFPFSCLSAEGFARAGAYILDCVGADSVCFGSECGDISRLRLAADVVSSPEFAEKFAAAQKERNASASAFFEAYELISGRKADFGSNDLLGISYIRAINELGLSLMPHTIKRTGTLYNSAELSDGFPSAMALRQKIYSGGLSDCAGLIPKDCLSIFKDAQSNMLFPVDEEKLFSVIQSFFRLNTPEDIKQRAISLCGGESIADDGDGIVERICASAARASSSKEFYNVVSSSRYTNSRIRRVILYSLIGVSDVYMHTLPTYTTLLGADRCGCEYLSSVRKSAKINIVTKPADMPECIGATLSKRADSLYSLLMPCVRDSGYFLRKRPEIMQ